MGTNAASDFIGRFSFFQPVESGMVLLWSTEDCEDCGCETEAPNSAKISVRGLGRLLKQNGLKLRTLDVGELGYSDTFGGAVCPECWQKHDG